MASASISLLLRALLIPFTTCCTGHINNKNEGTVTMDSTTIKGGGDDDDDDEF